MKKFAKSLIAGTLALACCGAFAFTGCGGSDDTETNTYTITFDYNYTGSTSTTQTVEEGATVSKPSDPTRDGYTFDDWYTTSACTSGSEVDFTAKIYANATYYAGWTEVSSAVTEYTVTFVLYDSSTTTQTVTSGDTAAVPDDPTRDGYVFTGWYVDSSCTTSYDFSAEITADTSIYAGWTQVEDGYVAVTYMWNYDGAGVYKVVTIEANTRLSSLESASRDGYLLKGWYTDEDCTQTFTSRTDITENIILYASWYKGYTFEAEYTNFNDEYDEPRSFYGYSDNAEGEQAIVADTTGTASNGYYVGSMYVSGAYLYFDIVSDTEVIDAVLYLRLAMGYGFGDITLSSSEYTITVNDTALSYSTLSLGAPATIEGITDFADYYIGNITLAAGTNTIKLEVTNSTKGEGGTQWAKAPYMDCIKIYSSSTLTWDPITSNIR